MFIHCREKHQFDIYKIHTEFCLDCFSYIKMINYIRKMHPEPGVLHEKVDNNKPLWQSDEYMKPILEDDGLLQFDIEDLCVESVDMLSCPGGHCSGGISSAVDSLQTGDERLLYELKAAQQKADSAEEKSFINDLVSSPDKVRTQSYHDAICLNPELFKDKVVLDIGCGTGILSMFAARAGARLVIGVEMSDVIYQAMDIIRENGLEDKVKLVKGRMEDVDLPVEKCMLDTVLWARDHYLNDDGVILPNQCSLSLAAIDDSDMYHKNCEFWDDVYGFKMSCMKRAVQREASVVSVDHSVVLSQPCVIKDIDIASCSTSDLEFTNPFQFTIQRDGHLTAVVGYFDVEFSGGQTKVQFSTSPFHTQTHWKQTVLIIDQPLSVNQGQIIQGQLSCKKNYKDPRSLVIYLSIDNKTYKYSMQ
ncbi:hypothetical protein LSH36_2036g00000 [Paralvinella palmiformis]|uniref:type I protein arginine methyltransferase n=1 Tax=Paralvinella palmiformis TaxID=53620 RepID=A0AAD9IRL0_9ANNE|nr:hypothetical protein LSH36_2036g00000 [Paralvinella palmiformis]